MHAASVHPEPGSNSLKNGIYNSLSEATYRFLELAYLSFLLLFRVSKFVRDSFTRTFVFLPSWCSKYLLFNFQRPLSCSQHSCCKLVYYTSAVSVCQGLFKTFFAFFQSLSFRFRPRLSSKAAAALPLGNAHLLYSRRFRLSSGFFDFFEKIGTFCECPHAAYFSGDFSKKPFHLCYFYCIIISYNGIDMDLISTY